MRPFSSRRVGGEGRGRQLTPEWLASWTAVYDALRVRAGGTAADPESADETDANSGGGAAAAASAATEAMREPAVPSSAAAT